VPLGWAPNSAKTPATAAAIMRNVSQVMRILSQELRRVIVHDFGSRLGFIEATIQTVE
jgi:hypothetical protein